MDAKSPDVGSAPRHEYEKPSDPLVTTAVKPVILTQEQEIPLNSSKEKKSNIISSFLSVKKELVPLKIVFVCWFGAFASVIPYLTIYFKHLGVTASETAFIYSFYPLPKLVGPALAGLIADKLGRYKPVLIVSLLFTLIFSSCFIIVPPVPERICQKKAQLLCWINNSSEIFTQLCCPESVCERFSDINKMEILNCSYEYKYIRDDTQIPKLCLNEGCMENNTTTIEFNADHKIYKNICFRDSDMINHSDISLCSSSHEAQDCPKGCDVAVPFTNSTFNCKEDWYERLPALAVILFVFLGFQFFVAICFSLVETTALAMVKEHNDDYGRQRFWAMLSTAAFAPLTGILIDIASENKGYSDYSPAFYLFDALIVIHIIFVYVLDLPVAPPARKIKKNIIHLLKSIEVIIFMLMIFFLGCFLGFIQAFLFWHLQDLGSPKYLLGLAVTVSCSAGLPFLYTSKWFVDKFGRSNLLIAAFVFYFIQLFGYSYIYNPWWFLLLECTAIFNVHLMWVATATYAAIIAPEGLLATVQGVVGGIHYGIGRGAGTLIGGYLIEWFGNRIAFQSMGIGAGIIGVVYALLYWLYFSRSENKRKEPAATEQTRRD